MNTQGEGQDEWPPARSEALWFALGRRIDGRRPERHLAHVLMILGTACLILSYAALAILAVTYQARLIRDAARSPVPAEAGMDGAGHFIPISDDAGGRWVDVFVVEPGENSQLPPGLSAWPEPGHVVLSPVLEGTEDGAEIVARYGKAAPQTIGVEGLASPTERLAYVRPEQGIVQGGRGYGLMTYGFPTDQTLIGDGQWGGALRQPPLEIAGGSLIVFLVIPSHVLMFVAARAGSGRRDKQQQLLRVLGASRCETRSYLAGSLRRPMLVGAATALLVIMASLVHDFQIPVVSYRLLASDLRGGIVWILLAAALGTGVAALIVRATNRVKPALTATRPQPVRLKERQWKVILLPAVCFFFVSAFTWSLKYTDTYARTLIVYVGIALIAAALPPFIGAMSATAARIMIALGFRRGSPGLLIAGRRLLSEPRGLRRLTAGVALVILLSAHVMVLGTVTNPDEQAARNLDQLVGGSVVTVGWPRSDREKDALADVIGDGAVYAGFITPDPKNAPGEVKLFAQCPALELLGLECGAAHLKPEDLPANDSMAFVRSLTYITQLEVTPQGVMDQREPEDSEAEYVLFAMTTDHSKFPIEKIRADLAHRLLPHPEVADVASTWAVGTRQQIDLFAWLPLFAGAAALMLVAAVLGALLGDMSVQADQAGVARMWSPDAQLSRTVAIGTVLVPVLIAIGVAAGVAFWTTFPLTIPPINGVLPAGYWMITVMLPGVLAVVIAMLAASLQRRRIEHWMPSKQ